MKKIKFSKVIWVGAIFFTLIIILLLVMDYKINYEYENDFSGSLYFYDCDGEICTSSVEDKSKKLYSVLDCEYVACPVYKKVINDNYALLEEENSLVLYDYKNGNVITSGYDDYTFINSEYIIVKSGDKYGVIDLKDNLVIDVSYEQIGYYEGDYLKGFNTSNIIAKKNGKYGIISFVDGKIIEEFKYNDEQLDTLIDKVK